MNEGNTRKSEKLAWVRLVSVRQVLCTTVWFLEKLAAASIDSYAVYLAAMLAAQISLYINFFLSFLSFFLFFLLFIQIARLSSSSKHKRRASESHMIVAAWAVLLGSYWFIVWHVAVQSSCKKMLCSLSLSLVKEHRSRGIFFPISLSKRTFFNVEEPRIDESSRGSSVDFRLFFFLFADFSFSLFLFFSFFLFLLDAEISREVDR